MKSFTLWINCKLRPIFSEYLIECNIYLLLNFLKISLKDYPLLSYNSQNIKLWLEWKD